MNQERRVMSHDLLHYADYFAIDFNLLKVEKSRLTSK